MSPPGFHDPKPVEKCACGADCEWCVGANRARAAFPNARVAPKHDADTEHQCLECFLKRDDLEIVECGPMTMKPWLDGEEPDPAN